MLLYYTLSIMLLTFPILTFAEIIRVIYIIS